MYANKHGQYIRTIQRHFPEVAVEHIQRIEEGWQHANFLVDGRSICRFSPSEDGQAKLRVEATFLQSFAPTSPLPIPRAEFFTDTQANVAYIIYDYMPGTAFSADLAATLTPVERLTIARGLGRFLGAMHSFSPEHARAIGVGELDPRTYGDYFLRYLAAFQSRVSSYLSSAEQQWVVQLFMNFTGLIKHQPFQTSVTHSDFRPEHIIVAREARQLPAIIDFGGVRIADPANDFAIFNLYGAGFLEEAYKHYDRRRDENFDARRQFYAGNRFVYEFERWVKLRDAEQIALHQRRLSEYIVANPHR